MKNKTNKYLIVLIIAIATIFVLRQYKDATYSQLDKWKLIPRQERFTELYFADHINLPKQISKGEKISFAFVIHNLEGENREYPYVVYFKSPDGKIVNIEEKTVRLEDDGYRTVEESYTPTLPEDKGGFFIELKEPQQSIHFLLADK